MSAENEELLEDATRALVALQNFDAKKLGRRGDLGTMNFDAVIPAASKVIELFRKVPVDILDELPEAQLKSVLTAVNASRKLFDDVLAFDLKQPNPDENRTALFSQIRAQYKTAFPNVYPWISYGVARTVDFNGLDAEARAVVKSVEDKSGQIQKLFDERQEKLDGLEEQLRATLAEQGVSQQARYFSEEANLHGKKAEEWGKYTLWWAGAVFVAAFLSFFTHRIPVIAPTNVPEAIQFIASKVLLIGALTFMLVRSARNYSAHRHNEITNRHKQNSLLTFNALVEAGSTPETRNIILNHAASSIYASPESGYVRSGADKQSVNANLVELMPRATVSASEAGS